LANFYTIFCKIGGGLLFLGHPVYCDVIILLMLGFCINGVQLLLLLM